MDPEDQIIFRQENLPMIAFAAFEDMRRNGELCDAVVKIEDRSFPVHRLVIAARIPYLRNLFSEDDTRGRTKEVTLNGLDADAVELLIRFAYTGQVTITDDNVRNLLTASCDLEVSQVEDACCQFLGEKLDINNVMEVRHFGCDLTCQGLVEICDSFVLRNFCDFSQSEEFFNLPFNYVRELTSRDDLHVEQEEKVFEVLLKWVKTSPLERSHLWPTLVENVRMTLLPLKYLNDCVLEEEMVKDSECCRRFIDKAKDYHSLPKKERMLQHFSLRPRR